MESLKHNEIMGARKYLIGLSGGHIKKMLSSDAVTTVFRLLYLSDKVPGANITWDVWEALEARCIAAMPGTIMEVRHAITLAKNNFSENLFQFKTRMRNRRRHIRRALNERKDDNLFDFPTHRVVLEFIFGKDGVRLAEPEHTFTPMYKKLNRSDACEKFLTTCERAFELGGTDLTSAELFRAADFMDSCANVAFSSFEFIHDYKTYKIDLTEEDQAYFQNDWLMVRKVVPDASYIPLSK